MSKPLHIEKHGDQYFITTDMANFRNHHVKGEFAQAWAKYTLELERRSEHQADKITDLQYELEQANKKLKQFKRTFVEARALHDLRGHVNKLLESKARIGMLPPITLIAFDEEMRRFIKQYQDRVEAWPVNASTGELLPHVLKQQQELSEYHHAEKMFEVISGSAKKLVESVLEAGEKVVPKKEKPRIRYLRQIPYGAKKVGWMNMLSPQTVSDAVNKWESELENEGYTLGVFKCGRIYEFYKVQRREQN